ncbi:unnamed protein product [Prorocentrum cordatum]|uniref:Subtilisin n=1 Tax=Prorocentrum cordatum TaxID=2364126 RepID=A0ABN9SRL4_9DINO|nr:unnamed protein product [Polarella glacialis]
MFGIMTYLCAVGLAATCAEHVDMQLMQMHTAFLLPGSGNQQGCHTSTQGEECYEKVMWAMRTGIKKHPEWYLPLTSNSSLEDFQQHLHATDRLSDACPKPCAAAQSEERLRTSFGTPMPTALHVGTPMPTEIHLDDLLTSVYPGYEQVGRNCQCGTLIRRFSEEHDSLESCAEECNLYPHCDAIAIQPWQSIWRGQCDLFTAACEETNGHDSNTTCADPYPAGAISVNFNRMPTSAPTPAPTASLDACDVTDGSFMSSSYPCQCGSEVCVTNEVCSRDRRGFSCDPPGILKVEWPCLTTSIGSPYFVFAGSSVTGAPVYSNTDGHGGGHLLGRVVRWH